MRTTNFCSLIGIKKSHKIKKKDTSIVDQISSARFGFGTKFWKEKTS